MGLAPTPQVGLGLPWRRKTNDRLPLIGCGVRHQLPASGSGQATAAARRGPARSGASCLLRRNRPHILVSARTNRAIRARNREFPMICRNDHVEGTRARAACVSSESNTQEAEWPMMSRDTVGAVL